MSPDPEPSPRARLLADVLAVGSSCPLIVAGEDAVRAHGLADRPARGHLELATDSPVPMDDIAAVLRSGLEARGWRVRRTDTTPLSARLLVTDPATDEDRAVDVVKETLWRPPVRTEHGLVLAAEDVVGLKVRDLADRGFARDLLAVRAAADRRPPAELEELGRRHARDVFDLADLRARLDAADWTDDRELAAHGLDEEAIAELRRWAQAWADDIGERLIEEAPYEEAVEEESGESPEDA